jgi:protocatechuate 3,4-dioxygenase, beta subunit
VNDDPRIYASSILRTPAKAPVPFSRGATEAAAVSSFWEVDPRDHDLTAQHAGEPHGQRIVVEGRVLDRSGRPIPRVLIELWQANAAGRYRHPGDQHSAPLDPNFTGRGRCVTDERGRYRFVTVKPGAYPWKNHPNAWRPAHIHFSLIGQAFSERLVTQMYFPDDPLFSQDPIFNAVSDPKARSRMIARFALEHTVAEWALGFAYDVVLGGPRATPLESRTG